MNRSAQFTSCFFFFFFLCFLDSMASSERALNRARCSGRDISISQDQVSSSGIPHYRVQIVNTCLSDCAASDLHLHCGWFSSANLVNPRIFKRLSHDDCLVNGGQPLKPAQTITFTYSTTFMFPLTFKSANFC